MLANFDIKWTWPRQKHCPAFGVCLFLKNLLFGLYWLMHFRGLLVVNLHLVDRLFSSHSQFDFRFIMSESHFWFCKIIFALNRRKTSILEDWSFCHHGKKLGVIQFQSEQVCNTCVSIEWQNTISNETPDCFPSVQSEDTASLPTSLEITEWRQIPLYLHCVKIVHIWSYSVQMRENKDQSNSEYGHFLLCVLNQFLMLQNHRQEMDHIIQRQLSTMWSTLLRTWGKTKKVNQRQNNFYTPSINNQQKDF